MRPNTSVPVKAAPYRLASRELALERRVGREGMRSPFEIPRFPGSASLRRGTAGIPAWADLIPVVARRAQPCRPIGVIAVIHGVSESAQGRQQTPKVAGRATRVAVKNGVGRFGVNQVPDFDSSFCLAGDLTEQQARGRHPDLVQNFPFLPTRW